MTIPWLPYPTSSASTRRQWRRQQRRRPTPLLFSPHPSSRPSAATAAAFRDISVRARAASSHPRHSVLVARGYAAYLPLRRRKTHTRTRTPHTVLRLALKLETSVAKSRVRFET